MLGVCQGPHLMAILGYLQNDMKVAWIFRQIAMFEPECSTIMNIWPFVNNYIYIYIYDSNELDLLKPQFNSFAQ